MDIPMRLAVVGSRGFTDYKLVKDVLDRYHDQYGDDLVIISGGAIGADSLGAMYAKANRLKLVIHKPDWNKYGRSAGFRRNHTIWDDADAGVAFWDGKSKGTSHSFDIAKQQNKQLEVITSQ
jgi:hypothetical protein